MILCALWVSVDIHGCCAFYGYLWVSMSVRMCDYEYMSVYAYLWVFMDVEYHVSGCLWATMSLYMGVHGCLWIFMSVYGRPWRFMGVSRYFMGALVLYP